MGLAAGLTVAVALIFFSVSSWHNRQKPWSAKAITAKIDELLVETRNEDLHFKFAYALTNNTNTSYTLPTAGMFARKLAATSSLQRVPETSWDQVVIPAHQTITTVFDVTVHPRAYGTRVADLDEATNGKQANDLFATFVGHRLGEFRDGFVFMDYGQSYRIELPQNWAKSPNVK